MISFFNHTTKEIVAVIDIRDGGVSGMLFSLDKKTGSIPEKLFSTRRVVMFQKNFDHKRLFFDTKKALLNVMKSLQGSRNGNPTKIFCVLGPHLYASQTRTIKVKYDNPTTVTNDLINKIILDDVRAFEQKHLPESTENTEHHNSILEHNIMQIKLNGYEVLDPLNKKASEVDISVFVSISPASVIKELKEQISKHFHNNNVTFHSSVFVAFDTITERVTKEKDFILINTEDEVTEISIIKSNILEETFSFPLGQNFILRMLGHNFGTINEEAYSYLEMYNTKTGDPKTISKIKEILNSTKEVWDDVFNKTVKKISKKYLLPSNLYITSEIKYQDIFTEFITKANIPEFFKLNRTPILNFINCDIFKEYYKNNNKYPDNVNLLFELFYINKIFHKDGLTLTG
ncbi:MAG: hypothetical protein WCO84_03560 [bacterium]